MFDGLSAQANIVSEHESRIKRSEDAIMQVSNRLAELDRTESCVEGGAKISE